MVRISEEFIQQMDELTREKIPYFFIIDYPGEKPIIQTLDSIDPYEILYDFPNSRNVPTNKKKPVLWTFEVYPPDKPTYKAAFKQVIAELKAGNSYLINLTFRSKIVTNLNLREIFFLSHAPYKLYYKDRFTVFSPEKFCLISDDHIYTYPMKGTINANIPNARDIILSNKKEMAEHATIVDLLRNDLSMVSENVKVVNYRYLSKIKAFDKELFQVSSKIGGIVKPLYREKYGTLISKLLPAGSVTGAPKTKTIEIINRVENYERGYYTGIMGIFDGVKLVSAVMIRFMEQAGNQIFFKSGGGLTNQSILEEEYNELIQKIYVPVR